MNDSWVVTVPNAVSWLQTVALDSPDPKGKPRDESLTEGELCLSSVRDAFCPVWNTGCYSRLENKVGYPT